MNFKKTIFPALLVCTALALAARHFVRPAEAKAAPQSNPYAALDAYVEEQLQRLNVPGASLAVVDARPGVDGDRIVHLRSYGQAHPDGRAPTVQTPFRIGSLTKSFTALAVMQLVEAGKIELDASVQRYLPWFRVADAEASAQITVRHLLHQTSGLDAASGWTPLADFDASPDAAERQARALATLDLNHPVGEAFEYTNANYNLLGLIVEAASGESYADYVQAHIFDPLGMENSSAAQVNAPASLATGHRLWFWTPISAPDMPAPLGSLASGQLISTSEDMARYLIALLNEGSYGNERILSPAGVAELQRGVAQDVEMGIEVGKYGMGWYASEAAGTTVVWHHGMAPDFSATMALVPEQKKGVVLLMNVDHFLMSPMLAETATGMGTILAGGEPEPSQFSMFPWLVRSLLLIPLLQIGGAALTLRSLRRWRNDPLSRPVGARKWGLHVALPLTLNALVMMLLIPILGPTGGFFRLFMPDYAAIAMASSGFAGLWGLLRTGLVLRELGGHKARKPAVGELGYVR
jgi:CubicO group peptidase (beta-lactamase class C family)